MSLQPGIRLGPYEILSPLGAGGMGEVWKARDTRLDRMVAVKVLPEHLAKNAESLARFERETKAVAALNHPNITGIFDIGRVDDTAYAVMELLEGETLRARLAGGALPPRKATELAIQLAQGLAAAHEKGVVHRDLKPDNLWITKEGRLKILDFGLAKQLPAMGAGSDSFVPTAAIQAGPHTEKGMILGTMGYMSPEQIRGEAVDARADIFAFGAVLFELLTGLRAFARNTAADTMAAILKEEPPDLSESSRPLPPGLQRILDHCLEKEPARRFHDAQDLAFALENALGSSSERSPFPALTAPAGRQRRWAALAAGLLLACAVGLAAGWLQWARPAPMPTFTPLTLDGEIIQSARFTRRGQSVIFGTLSKDRKAQHVRSLDLGNPVIHDLLGPDAQLLSIGPRDELAVLTGLRQNMRVDVPLGILGRCPPGGALPQPLARDIVDADWGPDGVLAVVRRVGGGVGGWMGCQVEYPEGRVLLSEPNGWLRNLRFSPDGRQLAVARHPEGADDLGRVTLMDLKTGRTRDLTPTWSTLQGLAWHPGGREIWFTATDGGVHLRLYGVDLKGRVRHLFNAPVGLCIHDISSDGRVLLSSNDRSAQLWTGRTGGKAPLNLSIGSWSRPKDLSSDGRWAILDDESTGIGPGYPHYLRPTDGSLPTPLGMGATAAFSQDGQRICLWRLQDGNWKPVVISLSGGQETWPTGDLELSFLPVFVWTAKGELLVQAKSSSRSARLWRLTRQGPEPIDFPLPENLNFFAAPEPTGDFLYLFGSGNANTIVDLRHPEAPPRPFLGLLSSDLPLGFSTDASVLFTTTRNGATHWRVNLRTGDRQQLKVPQGLSAADFVSGDGQTFLWSEFPVASRLFLVEGLR